MFVYKVLVWKCVSVDTSRSGSVSLYEIAALNHEVFDDSVECCSFVTNRNAVFSEENSPLYGEKKSQGIYLNSPVQNCLECSF